MAFSSNFAPVPPGNRRRVSGSITGPASYVTGGAVPVPSEFSLVAVDFISIGSSVDGTTFASWDVANSKLKIFTADGTEAANASDQSAQVYAVTVWGI